MDERSEAKKSRTDCTGNILENFQGDKYMINGFASFELNSRLLIFLFMFSVILVLVLRWMFIWVRAIFRVVRLIMRSSVLFVSSDLLDTVVITFLHEKLSKVVPAIQDTIKSSIGGVSERTPCMSTSKAGLVVAFSFQCHLFKRIDCFRAHCTFVLGSTKQ